MTQSAVLEVEGLAKAYPPSGSAPAQVVAPAVVDVAFSVREGELLTLLGPSGCGKTTTLRAVAGLETPDAGRITVNGTPIFDHSTGVNVAPNRRRLAMVFQSYAIWPHLSVARNVSFPLDVVPRRERLKRSQITARTEEVLDVVGLEGYGGRPATSLSGGQQQRLALARALVIDPTLLLLDEPLSNLDAKLRESMREELKRLQTSSGVASIYVTHDQEEALAMSTRIAVINEGRIVQLGTPEEIYEHPADEFVATFVGTSNLLRGTVQERRGQDVRIAADGLSVWARSESAAVGDRAVAAFRPEHVLVTTDAAPTEANRWTAQVTSRAYLGAAVDQAVRVGAVELRMRSTPRVRTAPGDTVTVIVAPEHVRLIPG